MTDGEALAELDSGVITDAEYETSLYLSQSLKSPVSCLRESAAILTVRKHI